MILYKRCLAILSASCILLLMLIITSNHTITPLHYTQVNELHSPHWSKGECLPIISRGSYLHPCVQQFLFHVNLFNLDIFVMEPSLLYLTLSDVERHLLTERGMTSFPKKNSTLFGVTEKGDEIKGRLVKKLVDIGFKYSQIIWPERNTPSHHFFTKNEIMVHVVVLFQRNSFFYSPAIDISSTEIELYLASNLSTIGKHPTSFDSFQLERKTVSGDVLQVPVSTMTFLMHFNWARFLECNREVSANFHRRYGSRHNSNLEKGFKFIVPILRSIMDPLAAPFWLASGTLLGWYRECGVIKYTTDLDFAAWSNHSAAEIDKRVSAHPQLKILIRFGYHERAFELTLEHRWARSDLFFMKEENNYTWYAGHLREKYFEYVYSKFTLCSAELLGLRVLVPCTPETTIEEEYGTNWREPISEWSYDTSAKNIGKTFNWTSSELSFLLTNSYRYSAKKD